MNSKKWKRVSVGEVVNELRITTENPVNDGIEHYIGFEHIESENLQVKQFAQGDIEKVATATSGVQDANSGEGGGKVAQGV